MGEGCGSSYSNVYLTKGEEKLKEAIRLVILTENLVRNKASAWDHHGSEMLPEIC